IGQIYGSSLVDDGGRDVLLGPRRVDEDIQRHAQRQRDPQAEQDLDGAGRPGGELGAVIFLAEIVAMLLARRTRVFLGHTAGRCRTYLTSSSVAASANPRRCE